VLGSYTNAFFEIYSGVNLSWSKRKFLIRKKFLDDVTRSTYRGYRPGFGETGLFRQELTADGSSKGIHENVN
jgi:hypothetical protein